jgi:general secretion pathway protein E
VAGSEAVTAYAPAENRLSLVQVLQEVFLQAGGNAAAWTSLVEGGLGAQGLIGRIIESNAVEELAFLQGLAFRISLPWQETIPPATELPQAVLPARIALKHHVLPLELADGILRVGLYDPFHHGTRAVLAQQLEHPVRYCLVPRSGLLAALQTLYGVGADTLEQLIEGREADGTVEDEDEVNIIDEDDAEASVMKFVNQIMREALRQRATDIHVEPIGDQLMECCGRCRFRQTFDCCATR